ncbi:MAG: NAD(P)/FAD-dependent oxidoreductase [Spirochaetota bacterium]
MVHAEVIIVGGGPAGAACAARLRRHGRDCLVLDKAAFPRPKPCAGWIEPAVLEDLGLAAEDYPHGLTTFPALHISIRGRALRLRTRQHAIVRSEFDAWLLSRSGATSLVHEVRRIEASAEGYLIDGEYSCRFLVGAGGTYCPVQRQLFRPDRPRNPSSLIVAMEEEFPFNWTDERCQLWFLENGLPGYSWYVPKANGIVNVGVGGSAEGLKAGGLGLKGHWDLLVRKLDRAGLVRGHAFKPVSHAYYLRRGHPGLRMGDAFVIGDAAGLATRDMGEGIGPAIRSGFLAAEAIVRGGDCDSRPIPRFSLLRPRIALESLTPRRR